MCIFRDSKKDEVQYSESSTINCHGKSECFTATTQTAAQLCWKLVPFLKDIALKSKQYKLTYCIFVISNIIEVYEEPLPWKKEAPLFAVNSLVLG